MVVEGCMGLKAETVVVNARRARSRAVQAPQVLLVELVALMVVNFVVSVVCLRVLGTRTQ